LCAIHITRMDHEHLHYFNALPVTLHPDAEEVFYHHPKYPFYCNQIGIIYDDEGYTVSESGNDSLVLLELLSGKRRTSLGKKSRMIFECYHQVNIPLTRITYKDGNIFNNSYYNLFAELRSTKIEAKDYFKKEKDFWLRSKTYITNRNEKLLAAGINPEDYWSLLEIPFHHWKKLFGEPKPKGRKKEINFDPVDFKLTPKMAKYFALFDEGLTNKQVMEKEGITSPSLISYYRRFHAKLKNI